jgi:hypothetical protein
VLDYLWSWGDEVLVPRSRSAGRCDPRNEWKKSATSDAAGGAMLLNPDKGAAKRASALASPGSYVEFTVNVAAGVPYRLWLRSRASGNSYDNDSLYVQFIGAVDAAGAPWRGSEPPPRWPSFSKTAVMRGRGLGLERCGIWCGCAAGLFRADRPSDDPDAAA